MLSLLTLAAISGQGLVHAVIVLIVLGVVFALLYWLVNSLPLFQPFKMVANAILMIVAVLILIGFLLSLIGYDVIKW